MGEGMGNGTPGFFREQIEDDDVLVFAGEKETRIGYRRPLAQRRDTFVVGVVLQREHLQGHRHVELVAHDEVGEDPAHLLQPDGYFTTALLARISDDVEVCGAELQPAFLSGWFFVGQGDSVQKKREGNQSESTAHRNTAGENATTPTGARGPGIRRRLAA